MIFNHIFKSSNFVKKKKEDKNTEDEEMIKVQINCTPNLICYKCSVLVEENENINLIIKYFDDDKKYLCHLNQIHKGENKNDLALNMDSFIG